MEVNVIFRQSEGVPEQNISSLGMLGWGLEVAGTLLLLSSPSCPHWQGMFFFTIGPQNKISWCFCQEVAQKCRAHPLHLQNYIKASLENAKLWKHVVSTETHKKHAAPKAHLWTCFLMCRSHTSPTINYALDVYVPYCLYIATRCAQL